MNILLFVLYVVVLELCMCVHLNTVLVRLGNDIENIIVYRGVPALVDFAAMRDAVKKLGGDPKRVNPVVPADLVIDHSVQVDVFRRYT